MDVSRLWRVSGRTNSSCSPASVGHEELVRPIHDNISLQIEHSLRGQSNASLTRLPHILLREMQFVKKWQNSIPQFFPVKRYKERRKCISSIQINYLSNQSLIISKNHAVVKAAEASSYAQRKSQCRDSGMTESLGSILRYLHLLEGSVFSVHINFFQLVSHFKRRIVLE